MLTIRSSTARISAIMRNIRMYRSLSMSICGSAAGEALLRARLPPRWVLFSVGGMAQFLSAIRGSAVQRQFGERPAEVVHREDPGLRIGHAELLEHPVEVGVVDKRPEHRLVVPDIADHEAVLPGHRKVDHWPGRGHFDDAAEELVVPSG